MSKLDLNEVVELKVTRKDAAVLVIALGLSTGRMPGGIEGGLEGAADRLCDALQTVAPVGVVVRTMADGFK